MKMIGCVSLKRIPILLTVLVITIVGLSLISVPVAADDSAIASGVGTWKPTTSYPTNIEAQSCVVSGGYIYCVAGDTVVSPYLTSAVYFAKLSSSGVGTWKLSSANPYPTNLYGESCVVSGGYVFCVGGYTGVSPDFTNAVYFAKLSSAGVGTWNPTTSYPTIIGYQSCVVSAGYVYCVGGQTDVSPYILNAVYYAKLSSTGVGTWKVTTSYPVGIVDESCVVSGGYVYCVTGYPGGATDTSAVYFAKLSSSGVGIWKSTTPDSIATENQSCVVSGGYVYCVGGSLNGGPGTSSVYFAKLSSSGVGVWKSTTSYPINTYWLSCVVSGKHTYCVGGEIDVSPYETSAVYYASV